MPRDFRKLIAEKVTESWQTTPHFFVTREIGAAALADRQQRAREASPDLRITATDLMVEALATAIADRVDSPQVDVGLAVASQRGVMTPVLRDVLAADLGDLARKRAAAVERGRAARLSPADLDDPPFTTLSNLGPFGVDAFTGVIPLGQASMLTVGRISRRLVVDPDDTPRVRPMFTAILNADHRVLDGADAARVLERFATAVDAAESTFWRSSEPVLDRGD